LTLSWERPDYDGGAVITGYIVERCDATWGSGGVGWTTIGHVGPDTYSFRATKLAEGSRYHFRVSAENSVGVGFSTSTAHAVEVKSQYGELPTFRKLREIRAVCHYGEGLDTDVSQP